MAKQKRKKTAAEEELSELNMAWGPGDSSFSIGNEDISQAEFFKRLRAITKRARAEKAKAESSDDSS